MREITTTTHTPDFSNHRIQQTLHRPATAEDIGFAIVGVILLISGILGLCAPILKLSISGTAILSGNILCIAIGIVLVTLGILRHHQAKRKGVTHE